MSSVKFFCLCLYPHLSSHRKGLGVGIQTVVWLLRDILDMWWLSSTFRHVNLETVAATPAKTD